MIVCAHGNWSRVPENRHLKRVVGHAAIGFFHALPQVAVVSDSGSIREFAGIFAGVGGAFSHIVNTSWMVVRTTFAHWKNMLMVLEDFNCYPEEQVDGRRANTTDTGVKVGCGI
ncbi:MAG: hypothetical protein ABJ059_05900 [Hyphomicrobiales bacterium]